MESVVLVTDRTELRETLRRALRQGPLFRVVTAREWARGEFGPTRDRLFILDIPTPQSIRPMLAVAENWPNGFAGSVMAVLGAAALSAFQPSAVVDALMVEPFSEAEANLRVRHILWKRRMAAGPATKSFGDLVINTESYEVTLAGEPLDLTYKEYELLRFLISNPGQVFTRDMLLSRVWGEDYFGGTRTVDVHIRRLRLKLGTQYDDMIGTVRNVGYRFNPLREGDSAPGA